jgi:hypothetical protein
MKARKKNGAREMELRAAQEDFFTVAIGSEERHLRQLMIHPGVMGDSKRTQTQRRGYLPAAVPSGRAFLKSPVKVSRFRGESNTTASSRPNLLSDRSGSR